MEILTTAVSSAQLRTKWVALEQAQPGLRIREAACQLSVSEAQLLATTVGPDCIRLTGHWPDFLKRLPALGPVMSLTRNESCVLEHKGTFEEVSTFGRGQHHMGTVIGFIETRVFFKNWHVGFATKQEKGDRILYGLQIFDPAGEAVTKIYLEEGADLDAFWQLVNDFRSADQAAEQQLPGMESPSYAANVDGETFLADWAALQDTHDFFPMLRKHQVHRFHALQLAEGAFCRRVATDAVRGLLETAAQNKLEIMIFAGNHGNLQIHQGVVRTIRVLERGGQVWLNVLDPKFNMHLRQDQVDSAWIVEKPTSDGVVTSLEMYDAQRELIAQFFGLRKPGKPQQAAWADLLKNLR